MKHYKTTKEECEKNIFGICEGCGDNLTAIETIDNAGDPTYWQGCERCNCFRAGVQKKYFEVARKLVESGVLLPYSHMHRFDYENTSERLDYYLCTQTAGLSHKIMQIHKMLIELEEGELKWTKIK